MFSVNFFLLFSSKNVRVCDHAKDPTRVPTVLALLVVHSCAWSSSIFLLVPTFQNGTLSISEGKLLPVLSASHPVVFKP